MQSFYERRLGKRQTSIMFRRISRQEGTAEKEAHWLRANNGSRQRERHCMTEAMKSKHHIKKAKLSEADREKSSALLFDITVRDLIDKLTIASDASARLRIQNELVNLSSPKILGFLNAHAVNLCWSDMAARRSFASADVLLRDGAGLAILCRRLGMPPGINMNGTDFIPELLASRSGIRVALFGSDGTASAGAADVLRRRGVDVISAIDGFQLPERYIADAREKKPEMIVLAMGMPIQEKLAVQLRDALSHPCLIINGGAIIDFLAQRVLRAPKMMQRVGLEWFYRFLNEPLRLFGRYIVGNPVFLMRMHILARGPHALRNADEVPRVLVRGIVIASPGGEEGRGGMGTVTKLMAQQFRSRHPDCAVTVIDPRGHGSILHTPHQTMRALLQLHAAAKHGANVLHLQVSERSSFLRKGILALMARQLGMTVILHHHGAELIPFYLNTTKSMQSYVRYIVGLADVNIVLGQIWERFLIDKADAKQLKVLVLRNGVPDLAAVVSRNRSYSSRLRILSLAELCERKGTGDILRALSELKHRGLDVEAVLAGGGEIDKYKTLAYELGISDRLVFTGWIDRIGVEKQLSMADIFILPSDNEGLPMAIIEALSLKLPVITTPVGAIPEVLKDKRDCKMVPPHDPLALANAIATLAADRSLMVLLGEAGRKIYDAELTIDIFIDRLWTIYEAAIKYKQI